MSLFDTLFPTSKRAIQRKGQRVAGGTGPVRMKRAPNLLSSIFGVFIGIAMLIASPVAMWMAYDQNRAADFESAMIVESDSSVEGYISIEGSPAYSEADAGEDCVDGDCIYQKAVDEEQFTRQELECSNNIRESADLKIIRQNGSECDSNGDCVPCYDVERKEWEEQKTDYAIYPVTVGTYVVEPTQGAEYLELAEKTIEREVSANGNPQRTVFNYFRMPSKLVVAGDSDGERITEGEKTFVISSFGREATLDKLKQIDRTNKYALFAVTFFVVFIGLLLMLGPLAWFGSLARFVPVIGPMLSRGSTSLVALIALILAIPIWILIFLAVTVLQVWWAAVIAILLMGALLIFWMKRAKDEAEV